MILPMVDLVRQYSSIKTEIDKVITDVLAEGSYIQGKNVAAFEREFASYLGVKHAIAVNSGTDALIIALEAAGVTSGETITVANTVVSSAYAIIRNKGRPVFVDVQPASLTMNPQQAEKAITPKTEAILPVHMHGQTADMDELLETATKHGLITIEDAAHAHGAEYHGKKAGGLGVAAAFSFYPSKNLGAYGDGGMVTTNNEQIADKAYILREYGQNHSNEVTQKYNHITLGYNSRLDELQAAVLRVKLRHLDEWNTKRRNHAKLYNALLSQFPSIQTPVEESGRKHVYHIYAIRCNFRDQLSEFLLSQGISTLIHYPVPLHKQPVFFFGMTRVARSGLKVTEESAQQLLSLPMFPELQDWEIETISSKVAEFVRAQ